MKRPTFFQGTLLAAGLGLVGSLASFVLLPWLSIATLARLLVPVLVLIYLGFLLVKNPVRTGKVTTMLVWFALSVAAWIFVPGFVAYLLVHTAMLWLIRSLYFYSGVLPSVLDLCLSGTAVLFGLATLQRTGSVFLAVWGYFLTQALFVLLPQSLRGRTVSPPVPADDSFERSKRQAEAALKQLIS